MIFMYIHETTTYIIDNLTEFDSLDNEKLYLL